MPHNSKDYSNKALDQAAEDSGSSNSSIVVNVWELTDYEFLSAGSSSPANSYGEAVFSQKSDGANAPELDKEARHLRKYLYANRKRFDQIIEDLRAFDADSQANW